MSTQTHTQVDNSLYYECIASLSLSLHSSRLLCFTFNLYFSLPLDITWPHFGQHFSFHSTCILVRRDRKEPEQVTRDILQAETFFFFFSLILVDASSESKGEDDDDEGGGEGEKCCNSLKKKSSTFI